MLQRAARPRVPEVNTHREKTEAQRKNPFGNTSTFMYMSPRARQKMGLSSPRGGGGRLAACNSPSSLPSPRPRLPAPAPPSGLWPGRCARGTGPLGPGCSRPAVGTPGPAVAHLGHPGKCSPLIFAFKTLHTLILPSPCTVSSQSSQQPWEEGRALLPHLQMKAQRLRGGAVAAARAGDPRGPQRTGAGFQGAGVQASGLGPWASGFPR